MRIAVLMLLIILIVLGSLLYLQPKGLFPPEEPVSGLLPAATRAAKPEPEPDWTLVVCATGGSDRNDGSASRPFATIQHAANVARPGDRILVREGLYAESVVIRNSGTAERPIVFAGERGEGGEWLTIMDRSTPVDGWVPAPEVGHGVYKTEALDFAPPTMLLDGRQVVRIPDGTMQDRGGFEYLRVPPDETISRTAERPGVSPMLRPRRDNDHGFWDGVEVIYGNRAAATYIRFRNGEHPAGRDLRAAYAAGEVNGQPEMPPDGPNRLLGAPSPAFLIYNRQHVEIRDFRIRSAEIGVVVRGSEATDNIIADNYLSNGRMRVLVHEGAARNVVSGNRMTLGLYGHPRPGAWDSHPLNHHMYRVFKNIVGSGTSDDVGVHLQQTGTRNVVRDNDIFAGLIGIRVIRSPEAHVYRNVIRNMSSVGIVSSHDGRVGNVDTQYFDNFAYDCNLNLRIHAYHGTLPGQRREYYYRNIFHSPPGSGSDVFFHWAFADEVPEGMGHPEFYFYHNVFSSNQVFRPGRGDGLKNTVLFNNVFDSAPPTYFPARFSRNPAALKAFAHNYASQDDDFVSGQPGWYGAKNLTGGDRRIWEPAPPFPDFRLPEGHPARHAGLDLSRPFTAAGRTFPALPGMEPGYFQGPAPHLGVLQEGDSASALLKRAASLIPENDG